MYSQLPFVADAHFSPCAQVPAGSKTGDTGPAHWFLFAGGRLLVVDRNGGSAPPCGPRPDVPMGTVRTFGHLDGTPCHTAALAETVPLPPGCRLERLRGLFGHLPEAMFAIAGRAAQLLQWDRDHRFCGRCGEKAAARNDEFAMECPCCGLLSYPRISPAVIMAITRPGEILLASAPHFPKDLFSTLAGFVEPGETLEQAVAREVREEVSVVVSDIRYFGSQPWPFPHSLMIGFTASWSRGEIRCDDAEITEARWFPLDDLPRIPSKMSIARALIDHCQSGASSDTEKNFPQELL